MTRETGFFSRSIIVKGTVWNRLHRNRHHKVIRNNSSNYSIGDYEGGGGSAVHYGQLHFCAVSVICSSYVCCYVLVICNNRFVKAYWFPLF